MGLSSNIVIPVVVGVSLCGLSGVLLYVLLRRDQGGHSKVMSSNRRTKEIHINTKHVPALIGRSGSNIKKIQEKSGTSISFRDSTLAQNDGQPETRICVICGELSNIRLAEMLIEESLKQVRGAQTVVISVPGWATGKIIGRGGENIRDICHTSGAKIKVETRLESDTGPASQRSITITGDPTQIQLAQDIINQFISNEKKRREEESTRREPRGQYAGNTHTNNTTGNTDSQPTQDISGDGSLLEVFVSAVSSPSRFWLQIVGPQVERLDTLVDMMTEYYSHSDNRELHKLPNVHVGQLVAAIFRHDGKWYRAKVAEIKPNEFDPTKCVCDVHFVDYGDNEYVGVGELVGLRTDMLQLRFQAVECCLAGVGPKGGKWHPKATERFEELTQVARWKRLWSKTCSFRSRPPIEGESDTERSRREGSPIPGVRLYDVRDGIDIDIANTLVEEGWAEPVEDDKETSLPPLVPTTPLSPTLPPPTFGDLQSSRVLGMVVGEEMVGGGGLGRDERSASLPHAPSPRSTPLQTRRNNDEDALLGDKLKSTSLATGMDSKRPSGATQINGSHVDNQSFIDSEKKHLDLKPLVRNTESFTKAQPVHIPDPKDEFKAKFNRVDSHHGNLEALGRSTPPKALLSHK